MAQDEPASLPFLAVSAAVGAVVLLVVLLYNLFIGKQDLQVDSTQKGDEREAVSGVRARQPQKRRDRRHSYRKENANTVFTHQWLATTLKGHSAPILGLNFSPNGKLLASCAEDRTILTWNVKDFTQKEHKSVRSNVELDHVTKVKFSPDCRALIGWLYNGNTVRVFKLTKKKDGTTANFQGAFDFDKKHDAEIINIDIASSGKYIMTCSKDTSIKLWDLKGEILDTIDTHQINNTYGAVSPCGRFVASSGFTPDVKVWEVCFDKSGSFKEIVRAFELTGHSAGIYHFDFSADSHRMATVSKDGTWKLWDTDIEYQKKQDPCLLQTGQYENAGKSMIALSPDGRTVAIATGTSISVFNGQTGVCEQTFREVHNSAVIALTFDLTSTYLVSAGDKHIQVLHNVVGHRATLLDLAERVKKAATYALKERIQQQMEQTRNALQSIGALEAA
ncbi:Transducin beta-like protein 2 [Lamellibrachia satsuma]|nr:Transducin beta-like protein 2 [Lamellibrachia satsuma]